MNRTASTLSPAASRALGAHPLTATLAAVAAGLITLPPDLLDALDAVARCEQAQTEPERPDPDTLRAALVTAAAAAITEGKPIPAVDKFHAVDVAARGHAERRRVLAQVHELLVAAAAAAFRREHILVTAVRPALLALVDQARALADEHGDVLGVDAAALMADSIKPEVLDAWRAFGRLVTGYGVLRDTTDALAGQCARDDAGTFREWTEAPSDPRLWGDGWRGRNVRPGWVPWPTEPRARLLWLVRSGLTVWVPTSSQRDERHLAEYPPAAPMSSLGHTIGSVA